MFSKRNKMQVKFKINSTVYPLKAVHVAAVTKSIFTVSIIVFNHGNYANVNSFIGSVDRCLIRSRRYDVWNGYFTMLYYKLNCKPKKSVDQKNYSITYTMKE